MVWSNPLGIILGKMEKRINLLVLKFCPFAFLLALGRTHYFSGLVVCGSGAPIQRDRRQKKGKSLFDKKKEKEEKNELLWRRSIVMKSFSPGWTLRAKTNYHKTQNNIFFYNHYLIFFFFFFFFEISFRDILSQESRKPKRSTFSALSCFRQFSLFFFFLP